MASELEQCRDQYWKLVKQLNSLIYMLREVRDNGYVDGTWRAKINLCISGVTGHREESKKNRGSEGTAE